MADRGIQFSAAMVRALIEGRKTQTRRLASSPLRASAQGDRLWVRETWAKAPPYGVRYPATDAVNELRKLHPSIHMPRWASRLTLLVTDVRVQRLRDISEADALAEGIVEHEATMTDPAEYTIGMDSLLYSSAVEAYAALWNSLHTDPGTRWEDNPWCVAISFTVKHGNIDQ